MVDGAAGAMPEIQGLTTLDDRNEPNWDTLGQLLAKMPKTTYPWGNY